MNTITVYGRVASDVESRDVGGANVAEFSLAANTKRKDKQTNQPITNFYRVTAWRGLGEIAAKYLKKGNRVCASGELVIRPYKDKNGMDQKAIELDANSIDLVETRAESEGQASGAGANSTPASGGFTAVESDDLPF